MAKRIKVRYLQNVSSPLRQRGIEGEVKFLPIGIARGLIASGYVVVFKESVKDKQSAKSNRSRPGVRVADKSSK